ncbi:MAG: ParB/RepB/Spo0J family partition protein [Nakamurella sp.]
MAKSKGGLGRGLAALIPTGPATNTINEVVIGGHAPATPWGADAGSLPGHQPAGGQATDSTPIPNPNSPRYEEIPVEQIRPNPKNPRTVFDEDALAELAHSIKEFGLLQPVVVRPADDNGYELVMGERRWRAAQRAGVATIAAIVRRTEDADLLRDALLENIHRSNLNPLEEAAAYQQLLEEFDVTHEELATRLGRSRPVISNTIRLLGLPVPVQRRVAAGVLSAGHARALLSLADPGDQEELATRIVAEGLSVRGTEEAVTLMRNSGTRRSRPTRKPLSMPGVADLAARLSDALDTHVKVQLGQRKGKIVVEFATVDDLDRIVGLMAPAVAADPRGNRH